MKRNRRKTEARILEAASAVVAEFGVALFSINEVARRAKADKVLIYRYFEGARGLLERLAEAEAVFPSSEAARNLGRSAAGSMDPVREVSEAVASYILHRPVMREAFRAESADNLGDNPLVAAFASRYDDLLEDVARGSGCGLDQLRTTCSGLLHEAVAGRAHLPRQWSDRLTALSSPEKETALEEELPPELL